MKKYLVIYRAPAASRQQMGSATPEQAKAGMDAWMSWSNRIGAALVEMGSPLGASASVSGGAAADDFGGYSVVQAESMDAAKRHFVDHPHSHMPGGTIELYELNPIPGM